jgi:hypothetical protein
MLENLYREMTATMHVWPNTTLPDSNDPPRPN